MSGIRSLIRLSSSLSALLVIGILASGLIPGQEDFRTPAKQPTESRWKGASDKEILQLWARGLKGRHYFLRSPRYPLLINDAVSIRRAKIKFFYPYDDGNSIRRYRVTLWFEGLQPAPSTRFRTSVEMFETLDELDAWLEIEFSLTPLEEHFEWSPEVRQTVRARSILPGMDDDMVRLVLGGLDYQVERAVLDEGRVRETWTLRIAGETRKALKARRSSSKSVAQPLGCSPFGDLPTRSLHIIFTDGRVTACETE
jgi:hypothetical protein